MKIEIRAYNTNLIDDIIKLKPEIISIGDDYCPWKLRSNKEYKEVAKKILDSGSKLRVVTSFIPEDSFCEIVEIINDLSSLSEQVEFVLNDYGLLSYLKNNQVLPANVIISQMLNHSLEEYLWSKEMMEEEDEKVKNNWLLSSFANSVVINYFKENYNLKGIIGNCLPFGQKSADIMIKNGIAVSFVDKLYTMAVARKCHCAMFYNKIPGQDCETLCNECFNASLNQVYKIGIDDDKYGSPSDDVKNKVQDWVIFGNAIYHEYPKELDFDVEKYKNEIIVISQRYYKNIYEIAEVINDYRR